MAPLSLPQRRAICLAVQASSKPDSVELMKAPVTYTCCATIVVLLATLTSSLLAQSRYYDTWHFSDSVGLDFRSGAPVPIRGNIRALEGCAVMCNPQTGDLLFYTNGVKVWNRNHQTMLNGTGLSGGGSSTQSSLATPHPGDSTLFYIFTTQSRTGGAIGIDDPPTSVHYGLRYSIVDMKKNGGLGEVVKKNVPLLNSATEKVAGVRHENGCGIWIITHELGGRKFYAWLLTPLGVLEPPVISDVWPPYSNTSDAGYLKASPDGKFLFAVRGQQFDGDFFRFNSATGVVGPLLAQVPAEYGASFSPDSKFLYVAFADELTINNQLVQYDLSQTDLQDNVVLTKTVGVAGQDRFFALQLGPDGKIYAARKNKTGQVDVAVINNPNAKGLAAGYQPIIDPTFPSPRYDFLGLPNCVDGFLGESNALPFGATRGVDIVGDTVLCFGQETQLSVDGGTAYKWEPADFLSCDDCRNPVAAPHDTTTYIVTVYEGEGCPRRDSITINVIYPPEPDAGEDQTICSGESVQLKGQGGVGFRWTPSVGLSCTNCPEPFASPITTTTYVFEATGPNGCSAKDSVTITVNGAVEVSASDSVICVGEQIRLQARGAKEYRWTPSIGLSCDDCPSPIVTPSRTTTYRVSATTDGLCPSVDSVTVIVHDPPTIFLNNDTTICLGESVQVQAWGGVKYAWSPTRGLSCADCPNPVATPTTTTTYRVWVANEFECAGWDSVTITVETSGTVEASGDTAFCAGGTAQLLAKGAESYRWIPEEGLSCNDCPNPQASPETTTTFYVTGTNSFGECPALDSVTVVVHPKVLANAGSDSAVCKGGSIQLNASGGTAYQWDPSPDLSCLNCSDPVASPESTTTYYVTVESMDGCAAKDSVTVVVRPALVVSAGADRAICVGDSVDLHAEGGVRWLWEPSTGLSCTDCPDPIATPITTTEYRLTAWSQEGCMGEDRVEVMVREEAEVIQLRIGRNYRGATGQELVIPIEAVSGFGETDISELELRLEYDAGVMKLAKDSFQQLLVGTALEGWNVEVQEYSHKSIVLRLIAPDGQELTVANPLLLFRLQLYLSRVQGTELSFNVRSNSNCFVIETTPGYAEVDSICGLSFRLIEVSQNKYVAPVAYPNPAHNRVTFEFGLGLEGRATFEVFDKLGRRVGLIVDSTLEPGQYQVEWDVQDVPTGTYWYRLTSGDWSKGGQLHIEN